MSIGKTVPGFSLSSFVAPKEDWYRMLNLQDSIDMAKEKMVAAAENFVAVGYYLKHIRDEELYKNKGYKNIWECAEHELNLTQSTASRYISICEKFSSDGNSPYLDEKFKEYGKSQLQEMLTISDQKLIEQVTPDMSVKQIQKLKKENKSEKDHCTQGEEPRKPKEEDVHIVLPGQMQVAVDGTFREIEHKEEKVKNEEDSVDVEIASQILTYNNEILEQTDTQEEQPAIVDVEAKPVDGYDMSLINDLISKSIEHERIYSGKKDKNQKDIFQGDIIENESGTRFEVRYGKFAMYCPVDDCMMENVGFYVVAKDYYEDMPLGPTEEYAAIIGNIYDNPNLKVDSKYRCLAEKEYNPNNKK